MPKTKNKQTKADFVRSLPRTLSASGVMAKAKAAGFDISAAHVYAIRSSTKKRAKKHVKVVSTHHQAKTNGHAKANGHAKDYREAINSAATTDLLRAVASELGLSNALHILTIEHDKVQRLIAR